MNTHKLNILLVSTSLAFAATAGAATTVLIDDPMDGGAGNYSSFSLIFVPTEEFEFIPTDFPDFGNPDAMLELTYVYGVDFDASSGSDVQTIMWNTTTSWTPSVDGVINSVTFSIDVFNDTPAFYSLGFVIQDSQGGNAAGFTTLFPESSWITLSSGPLGAGSFLSRDFEGALALQFGFTFTGEKLDADGVAEVVTMFADNFKVEIDYTPIPEPSAFAAILAATGLVMAGSSRRRRD